MSSAKSFEQAIEASHRALDEITRGNPEPFFEAEAEPVDEGAAPADDCHLSLVGVAE